MLKTSYKMLFIMTLISGTLITSSSSSWFSMWMGLEINLLSFIPIMMKTNNLLTSEASLKYFLIQALSSSILLFTIIMFSFFIQWNNLFNYFYSENTINLIFTSSLMMKSGMAPFHFWFPNVMEGLSWINNLILMTWQKIAPLIIMSYCLNNMFFSMIIIFSVFMGAIGGLNQTSLRKLMAFSSISHLGWMISNMMNNENLWKIYFLIYSFISFSIIFTFKKFNIFNLNQVFSLSLKNFWSKVLMCIPLLSLGGLPPFLGFFPKWVTIELLIQNNYLWLIFLMINFTLMTLYFYLRITFSSFLLNQNYSNWLFFKSFTNLKNNLFMNFLMLNSIFGLFFINIFSFYW